MLSIDLESYQGNERFDNGQITRSINKVVLDQNLNSRWPIDMFTFQRPVVNLIKDAMIVIYDFRVVV